jgi:hypothetical protein
MKDYLIEAALRKVLLFGPTKSLAESRLDRETKAAVEAWLKNNINDLIEDRLAKVLKSPKGKELFYQVSGQVLARLFEILHNKRTTWQSALK